MPQATVNNQAWSDPWTDRGLFTRAGMILGFAGALGLSAHVKFTLPFSPVPVTLQTFVVLLAGVVLGPRAAVAAVASYLAAGLLGAPVFAGGPSALCGVTAGYLLGFLPAAGVVGWLAQSGRRDLALLGMLLGMGIIYATGTVWLAAATGWSMRHAAALGVVPFVVGDALKIAAALLVSDLMRSMGHAVLFSDRPRNCGK